MLRSPLALAEVEKCWVMNLIPLATILVKIVHTITAMRKMTVITHPMTTSAQHIMPLLWAVLSAGEKDTFMYICMFH